MKAAYAPYTLNFITPGGTSRGVMTTKDTYFIKIWDESNPQIYGIGECALFKGLSAEDNAEYEAKLQELCHNIENDKATDLSCHSSIQFGFETAILDFANGGERICYPSPFTDGEYNIPINGLVWMGKKSEMIARIDEKVAAGFHTIKLKVGAIDFNQELEIIEYVRKRYSDKYLEIRLDANGGFTPQNALQRIEALSKFNIHSIEQPIKAGQWEDMSELCNKSSIAIALDEELIGITNPMVMMELLKTIQPHYIILKPSLMGGLSGSLEWLKMAAQFQIGGWITSALESNIGLNAIAQWVATLQPKIPQGLGTGALFTNNIPSALSQKEDYLSYNIDKKWQIPEFNWINI